MSEETTGQTSESPEAKRCKQEERDLSFLQVKKKDGQHCLFVDLGKKIIRFYLSCFNLNQQLGLNASLDIFSKPFLDDFFVNLF